MLSISTFSPMVKRKKLTEQLREIILTCGKSRYRIWQESGIEQEILSRFVNGKTGFTLKTLDKLGEVLNLQIVQAGKSKQSKRS